MRKRLILIASTFFAVLFACGENSPTGPAAIPVAQSALRTSLTVRINIVNDDLGALKKSDVEIRMGSLVLTPDTALKLKPGPFALSIRGPIGVYTVRSSGCIGTLESDKDYECSVTLDDEEPPTCDPNLLPYVYSPKRLVGLDKPKCEVTAGTVRMVKVERDGDLTILLDAEKPGLIYEGNKDVEVPGTLVVELICNHSPQTASAKVSCALYPGPRDAKVTVGQRIAAAGYFVLDLNHEKHSELHPAVFKILGEFKEVKLQ